MEQDSLVRDPWGPVVVEDLAGPGRGSVVVSVVVLPVLPVRGQGLGGSNVCECVKCGYTEPHVRGIRVQRRTVLMRNLP